MIATRTAGFVLLASLTATVLACTSGAPDKVAVMSPNPSNSLESESRDGGLPREFPRSLPLPSDRVVLYSALSPSGVVAYLSTQSSSDQVKALMLRTQSSNKWKLHVCRVAEGKEGPVSTLVFSTDSSVISVQIGYTPEAATRLNGDMFSFFVSITDTRNRPLTTAEPC